MISEEEILKASILIVDDQQANVLLLEKMLRKAGYQSITSTMDPHTVCELYSDNRYDLILLDLEMPGMNGFQVMEGLKKIGKNDYVPILAVTAHSNHKLLALASGAKDFISKPFDLMEIKLRIHNMLEVRLLYKKFEHINQLLENINQMLGQTVLEQTAELVIANEELVFQNEEKAKRAAELVIANIEKYKRAAELLIANEEKTKRVAELVIAKLKAVHNEKLQLSLMETIDIARQLVELRDPYTAGHEKRAGDLAKAIAAQLGLDASRQEGLMIAGYLHDIGKIIVPVEILCKPGKITSEEYSLIKNHVQAGYDLLKDVTFPWDVAQPVLEHHERLDGSGYPNHLNADQISIEGRILAVADVFEAMSSFRPYRPALGIEAALAEIERGRGSLYDETVVDACIKLFHEKDYKMTMLLHSPH